EEGRQVAPHLGCAGNQPVRRETAFQNGGPQDSPRHFDKGRLDGEDRLEGRVFNCPNSSRSSEALSVSVEEQSVHMDIAPLWFDSRLAYPDAQRPVREGVWDSQGHSQVPSQGDACRQSSRIARFCLAAWQATSVGTGDAPGSFAVARAASGEESCAPPKQQE